MQHQFLHLNMDFGPLLDLYNYAMRILLWDSLDYTMIVCSENLLWRLPNPLFKLKDYIFIWMVWLLTNSGQMSLNFYEFYLACYDHLVFVGWGDPSWIQRRYHASPYQAACQAGKRHRLDPRKGSRDTTMHPPPSRQMAPDGIPTLPKELAAYNNCGLFSFFFSSLFQVLFFR